MTEKTLAETCAEAVKALDGAAKAGQRSRRADKYAEEWAAQLRQRELAEAEAVGVLAEQRAAEARREAKRQRDRDRRARLKREREEAARPPYEMGTAPPFAEAAYREMVR